MQASVGEPLLPGSALRVRRAEMTDGRDLWRWRNEAQTRENSVNKAAISWPEHSRWLQKSLSNPHREIYIVELRDTKCGTIRFDKIGISQAWEVSIVMCPEFRGRGLARAALEIACAELKATKEIFELKARVRHQNLRSLQLFERSGFQQEAADVSFVFLQRPVTRAR